MPSDWILPSIGDAVLVASPDTPFVPPYEAIASGLETVEVTDAMINDGTLDSVVADLRAAAEHGGARLVGVAHPQLGGRLAVYLAYADPSEQSTGLIPFVNPEITYPEPDETYRTIEGCFSSGRVFSFHDRPLVAEVTNHMPGVEPETFQLADKPGPGFHIGGRVHGHEGDHLKGILCHTEVAEQIEAGTAEPQRLILVHGEYLTNADGTPGPWIDYIMKMFELAEHDDGAMPHVPWVDILPPEQWHAIASGDIRHPGAPIE